MRARVAIRWRGAEFPAAGLLQRIQGQGPGEVIAILAAPGAAWREEIGAALPWQGVSVVDPRQSLALWADPSGASGALLGLTTAFVLAEHFRAPFTPQPGPWPPVAAVWLGPPQPLSTDLPIRAEQARRGGPEIEAAAAALVTDADPAVRLGLSVRVQQQAILLRLSADPEPMIRARAADLLGQAVAIDGWRAEDAFSVAAGLSNEMLARIAAAAGEDARASARVRYAYAQELSRRKDFPAALAAAQQAVQEDPGFGPGWFRLGEYALRLKQEPEALAAFQRFLATDDRPLAMEGWAWYHLDRHEEAITRFRKAVAADPSNRWAWDGIALISRARDDRRNELGALRRILKMEPGNEKIRQRIDELEGK
jgi:hypothetical protein